MKKIFKIILVNIFLFVSISFSQEIKNIEEDFYNWIINFKKMAIEEQHIDKNLLDESFYNVKYNYKSIKKDENQPEYKKTFIDYYYNLVNERKVKNGLTQLNKYKTILNKVEKKYGVPKEIIVAFWGIETDYGRNKGKNIIIDNITTLAFDHRRGKFFTNELIYSFKILQKNKLKKEDFVGSWAGAFGHFQFMPSTYSNYAIDGNNDKKVDLNNIYDAIYSAGNFLSKLGWKNGYKWGKQVKVNKNLMKYVNESKWRKLSFFSKLGIKSIDNKIIKPYNIDAKIIAPIGTEGPFFIIYKNFNCMKLWNNSTNYALSVGLLADSIKQRKMIKIN